MTIEIGIWSQFFIYSIHQNIFNFFFHLLIFKNEFLESSSYFTYIFNNAKKTNCNFVYLISSDGLEKISSSFFFNFEIILDVYVFFFYYSLYSVMVCYFFKTFNWICLFYSFIKWYYCAVEWNYLIGGIFNILSSRVLADL